MKIKESDSKNANNEIGKKLNEEHRIVIIYGYSEKDLADILKHFKSLLPDYVKMFTETLHLVTRIRLIGHHTALELLRFKMNKYQQQLQTLFKEELITTEDKDLAQVLGELLMERELTLSCAESCSGGNLAHRITSIPGSSAYFLGSVVSYSNEVKAKILKVSRNDLNKYGAVSRQVAEQMATGSTRLMHSHCAMATTGIAGPGGGTKFKPVGTVWIAVKYNDNIVSELIHFSGDRNDVIQGATNHAMVMLIRLLLNSYTIQEEINDD